MPVYERNTGRETLKRVSWDLIPDHIIEDVLQAMGEWVPTVTSRPYGDEAKARAMREALATPDWVRPLAQARAMRETDNTATGGVPDDATQTPHGLCIPVRPGDDLNPNSRRIRVTWKSWIGLDSLKLKNVWGLGTVSHVDPNGTVWIAADTGKNGLVRFQPFHDREVYMAQGDRILYYAPEGPPEGRSATEGAEPQQEPVPPPDGPVQASTMLWERKVHMDDPIAPWTRTEKQSGVRVRWKHDNRDGSFSWKRGAIRSRDRNKSRIVVEAFDDGDGQLISFYGVPCGTYWIASRGYLYYDDDAPRGLQEGPGRTEGAEPDQEDANAPSVPREVTYQDGDDLDALKGKRVRFTSRGEWVAATIVTWAKPSPTNAVALLVRADNNAGNVFAWIDEDGKGGTFSSRMFGTLYWGDE